RPDRQAPRRTTSAPSGAAASERPEVMSWGPFDSSPSGSSRTMIRSTLTRPTLTRHSPSILPLVPQRTTAQDPWKDAKSLFESRILGRDHHQRDLALPGELDGDLLSGRSKSRNAGGWYGQRLTVPGRRPGQSRRRRLDPLADSPWSEYLGGPQV